MSTDSSPAPTEMSFQELLAKLRPRTTTGTVLVGLYLCGAAERPVPASEVSKLLKRHLRSKAPTKVSRWLRDMPAYVEVKNDEPPLLWSLTAAGLAKLTASTGLRFAAGRKQQQFKTDIGIVCALEHPELTAVLDAFGGRSSWQESRDARLAHVYHAGILPRSRSPSLSVVATTSISMGLTAAAIATTQLIYEFRPRIVAMIGIAAGTKQGNKQFGDILVADPSVDYNSGKVVQSNGIREFQPDPYPISLKPRLRAVLQRYKRDPTVFDKLRSQWRGAVPPFNTVHIGPLGAADQVIDDQSRIPEIQKNWRRLIGVEMETYAVYRACQEAPEPRPTFISFKSVCDFAAEKTDSWQNFASYTAATFAAYFFVDQWDALWNA